MSIFFALVTGTMFGFGLALSGMADPSKVQGFLDLAGQWDPTLAFVMVGALLVSVPAYQLALRKPGARPLLSDHFDLPVKTWLDTRLLAGSALFGLGWGLSGFCPGPAITTLVTGLPDVFILGLA